MPCSQSACHILNVVPSPLLPCCVDRSGPRNICCFIHRLSAAKFRLWDCTRLLNVRKQLRARETMVLMWQPELSEGPLHDFLSFCEDLEPVSTPSAIKRLACSSAMWQNMEDRRCPEPCFARLPVQQHVSGSGRAISLLLQALQLFLLLQESAL